MRLLHSNGQLDPNDSSFNTSKLQQIVATLAAEPSWNGTQTDLVEFCLSPPSIRMSHRRQAVYSHLCVRWSLQTECDYIKDTKGTLDDEGKRRRASFLLGEYALTPGELLRNSWLIKKSTSTKCSKGLYTGSDVNQLYKSGLNRTLCLLEKFIGTDGRMDISKLVEDGNKQDTEFSSGPLYALVKRCAGTGQGSVVTYRSMPAEDFVSCWAQQGVLSAAKQEASQVASSFPEKCSFNITKWEKHGTKWNDVFGDDACLANFWDN